MHNRPAYGIQALKSVRDQSYQDFQAIIFDSGILFDSGYYNQVPWLDTDTRFTLIRSNETEDDRATKHMPSWVYNECFRRKLIKGELCMCLADDDILYPCCFKTFTTYYAANPNVYAMYASQDVVNVDRDGNETFIERRTADVKGGKCCNGRRMDCQVDMLQFCHSLKVLDGFVSDEYMPETLETKHHADGMFMERVGDLVPIFPIDVTVSKMRRTPESRFANRRA